MLPLLVLCAAIAAIWFVARLLFSEGAIDAKGALYFRQSSASYTPLESRHNADPRKRSTRSPTTGDGLGGSLEELTFALLEKTRSSSCNAEDLSDTADVDRIVRILASTCCVIPADAERIQVLQTPNDFYETLKSKIRSAQHRIMISALYVGDGPLSKAFLQTLEEKVKSVAEAASSRRLRSFPGSRTDVTSTSAQRTMTPAASRESLMMEEDLGDYAQKFTVDVVLDYNRMHDRKNMMTIRPLAELASTYKHDVEVRLHLFQTPSSLNRLFGPFGRSKELLGVQHTKLFVFDGEDVLLTGANLSDDYFKNRMDRYLLVQENAHLAEWVQGALDCLISLSHRVVYALEDGIPADALQASEVWTPSQTPQKKNPSPHNSRAPSRNPSTESLNSLRGSGGLSPHTTHKKSKLIILPTSCGVDATRDHAAFREIARRQFDLFAAEMYASSGERLRYLLTRAAASDRKHINTLLFPTLQFGRIQIHHDVNVVRQVLQGVSSKMRVCLTSPYLNMYHAFTDAVLKSRATFDFITASLKSNGWSGQKGIAGQIPYFYFQLERSFFFLMESFGCGDRVRIREFTAPGLTFHAKGMWILSSSSPSVESTAAGPNSDVLGVPVLGAYGSTNYGNRSIHKDVEVEAFLFTWSTPLQEQMRLELQRLLSQSELATRDRFVGGTYGRFQPVVALVAALGQDFL